MTVPSTQTAVQLEQAGYWLDGVKVTEQAPVPTPGAGEVLVHLTLRPINPGDMFCLIGIYPGFTPSSYPAVPGMEGTGVVVSLGPEVTQLTVGQRVTSTLWPGFGTGNGTYQQYIVVPATALEVVPDYITDEAAACAVTNPVSVVGLLEIVGPVPWGSYLIVTAAGSALGRQLLAVCKDRGILTIAVVRRREVTEELLAVGASVVLVNTEEDITQRVSEITGGAGAYAALDAMAGTMTALMCRAVRRGGTVVVYGVLESPTFTLSVAETLFRNVGVRGYWYQLEIAEMTPAQRTDRLEKVWDLFKRGIISTGASATVPLSGILDAVEAHMDPDRPGKILLSS